jgi:hypothetical protein
MVPIRAAAKLDGQRHAVQCAADPGHGGCAGGRDRKSGQYGPGSLDQQPNRGGVLHWLSGKHHGPFGQIRRYGGIRRQRQRASGRNRSRPPRAGPGLDHRPGERAAQPGDQGLQRVRRPGRRLIGPQTVDQLAGRHQLARPKREHDQQRAQPGSADLEYGPRVVGADLKRPEHRDLHTCIVPDSGSYARLARSG